MKWTEIPAGELNAANQRLWGSLGDDADYVASAISNNPDLVNKLTEVILATSYNYKISKAEKNAKRIMGKNFLGIREAIKYFKAKPNEKQLLHLSEIPFSDKILEQCKDTHVLAAIFPIPISDLINIARDKHKKIEIFNKRLYFSDVYKTKNGDAAKWQLVLKKPLSYTRNKTWHEQLNCIDQTTEEVPSAQVLVYLMMGLFLSTREKLFSLDDTYVRSSDASDNNHERGFVAFGDRIIHGEFGINFHFYNSKGKLQHLAITTMKKHN